MFCGIWVCWGFYGVFGLCILCIWVVFGYFVWFRVCVVLGLYNMRFDLVAFCGVFVDLCNLHKFGVFD